MRAMVLAAGRGERMRPLTDHTPKPLLEVGGKPLIAWHLGKLAAAGFTEVVINHAYLGEQIEARLKDGAQFGLRIIYSAEGQALETAGGITKALHHFHGEPFAVINGDVYCDYDFRNLSLKIQALQEAPALACHLVVVDNPPHHPQGDFCLAGGRMAAAGEPMFTFSGLGVYQPRLFHHLVPGEKAPLAPLLRQAMAAGQATGEYFPGTWIDVGTPERLEALDRHLRQAAAPGPASL